MESTYDRWFQLADKDYDGLISGEEAVTFFQKSGLDDSILAEIWNLADEQDVGFLTRPKFYAAMALLSAAQSGGGKISEFEARRVLSGTSGVVPPPFMVGLQDRHPSQAVSEKPKSASLSFSGYAAPPQSYSGQHGFGNVASMQSSGLQLPAVTNQELNRYRKIFDDNDKNSSGYLEGSDCFGIFMQWNLPQDDLSQIWDLAAGEDGRVSKEQFVNCLYLMDMKRKGATMPSHLPPHFAPTVKPEVDHMAFLANQVESMLGKTPPPMSQAPSLDVARQTSSNVPELDAAAMSQLPAYERQRLNTLAREAEEADKKSQAMEAKALTSEERVEFFNRHMQELVLFKSRAETKLIEMEGRLQSAETELKVLERQYEDRFNASQGNLRSFTAKVEALNAIQKRRSEIMSAFEYLQMQESSSTNVAFEIQNGQNELVTLETQLKETEEVMQPMLETLSSRVSHRERLQFELDNAKLSKHVAKTEIERESKKIKELLAKLSDFSASAGLEFAGSDSGPVLQKLLDEGLSFIRGVKAVAASSGIKIHVVDEKILDGIADSEDFDDSGFVILDGEQLRPLTEAQTVVPEDKGILPEDIFADTASATKPPPKSSKEDQHETEKDTEIHDAAPSAWEFIAPSGDDASTPSQQNNDTKWQGLNPGTEFAGFEGL